MRHARGPSGCECAAGDDTTSLAQRKPARDWRRRRRHHGHDAVTDELLEELRDAGDADPRQCAGRCRLRGRACRPRPDGAGHALRRPRRDRARDHGHGAAISPRRTSEVGDVIDARAARRRPRHRQRRALRLDLRRPGDARRQAQGHRRPGRPTAACATARRWWSTSFPVFARHMTPLTGARGWRSPPSTSRSAAAACACGRATSSSATARAWCASPPSMRPRSPSWPRATPGRRAAAAELAQGAHLQRGDGQVPAHLNRACETSRAPTR